TANEVRSARVLHILKCEIRGLPIRGVDFRDHRNQSAVAVLRMRVPEFELSPLGESILCPPTIGARQCQNIGPPDRLLAIADCLGHGLPHRNYHWRENEILSRAHQILTGLRSRLSVSQSNKCGGCWTGDVALRVAA